MHISNNLHITIVVEKKKYLTEAAWQDYSNFWQTSLASEKIV